MYELSYIWAVECKIIDVREICVGVGVVGCNIPESWRNVLLLAVSLFGFSFDPVPAFEPLLHSNRQDPLLRARLMLGNHSLNISSCSWERDMKINPGFGQLVVVPFRCTLLCFQTCQAIWEMVKSEFISRPVQTTVCYYLKDLHAASLLYKLYFAMLKMLTEHGFSMIGLLYHQ